MAAKRTAGSELNQDNWNEYEPEEAGSFQLAPEDVLKRRVIKVAKRRRPTDETSSTKNVFSSFSGFGKKTNESPFTFLASLSNTNSSTTSNTGLSNTNGLGNFSSTTSKETSSTNISFKPETSTVNTQFKSFDNSNKPAENGTSSFPAFEVKSNTSTTNSTESTSILNKSNEYYANLKGLNESVSQWIKTHVDKNPFCILTPIFKDYEKYLKEIEEKSKKDEPKEQNKITFTSLPTSNVTSSVATTHSASIFGQSTKTPDSSIFGSKTVPNFGTKNETKIEKSPFAAPPKTTDSTEAEKSKSTTTFNVPSFNMTTKPLNFGTNNMFGNSTGFSFNSGSEPFKFSNVAKPPSDKKEEETKAEDEDEPPKVEFVPVVEEDHIFSKRCKVFVKKDGNFTDRGVGQLFLKPVSGSEKVQLIVRADTNIGNLLLNFILSESLPTQRMGKNNVMIVCIPMPDAKPPPVPILLRVKTAEEADELLTILEKHKK